MVPVCDLFNYAVDRVEKGGFNVTSTCEFSDEMCQGKGSLFENSTRDDLSSKNESKRVKTDRDTSLERSEKITLFRPRPLRSRFSCFDLKPEGVATRLATLVNIGSPGDDANVGARVGKG